jgi:hypothetical protein
MCVSQPTLMSMARDWLLRDKVTRIMATDATVRPRVRCIMRVDLLRPMSIVAGLGARCRYIARGTAHIKAEHAGCGMN